MADTTLLTLIKDVGDQLNVRKSGTLSAATTTLFTVANTSTNAGDFLDGTTGADTSKFVGDDFLDESTSILAVPNPVKIKAHAPAASTTTATLTPAATMSVAPGLTGFGVYSKHVPVSMIKSAINRALAKRTYESWYPLTLLVDGDMETSGVGDHTAVASGVPTKVATPTTDVLFGPQSLKVAAAGTASGSRFEAISVEPLVQNTWLLWAIVRADVGDAKLQAWDATNSAEIDSKTWTYEGWGVLCFTFTVPLTCRTLHVRLLGNSASDIAFWNRVGLLPVGDMVPAPDWMETRGQLKGLYQTGTGSPGSPFIGNPTQVTWSRLESDMSAVGSQFKIRVPRISGPLWAVVRRPFASLSAMTDTTFMPRYWANAAAKFELLRVLRIGNSGDPNAAQWGAEYKAMLPEISRLDGKLNGLPYLQLRI